MSYNMPDASIVTWYILSW